MPDIQRNMVQSRNGHAVVPGTKLRRAMDSRSAQLASARQQLESVMQKNDELMKRHDLLTKKVNSLNVALAKTYRFAHYDELTGLPNRRLLLERFIQAASLAMRHRQLLALLFFDLDDFKSVNDRLGHEAGDKLLQQVAQRLSSVIRKSDSTCRYGGDEFVVLMTELDNRQQAVKKINEIRAHFVPPYVVGSHSIQLSVSIGLATYPNDSEDFNELLRMSDRSMFSDKADRRVRVRGPEPKTHTS